MGDYLADPGEVGGSRVDIGEVLPGRCSGNTYFRLGDVDGDNKNWEGPGGVSPSGRKEDNRESSKVKR